MQQNHYYAKLMEIAKAHGALRSAILIFRDQTEALDGAIDALAHLNYEPKDILAISAKEAERDPISLAAKMRLHQGPLTIDLAFGLHVDAMNVIFKSDNLGASCRPVYFLCDAAQWGEDHQIFAFLEKHLHLAIVRPPAPPAS